jgi:Ca2+-binding RTX toxin-like protein
MGSTAMVTEWGASEGSKQVKRASLFSIGVLAAASLVVLGPGMASADACTFDPATHAVSISYSGLFQAEADNEVKVNGADITFEGAPCPGATVTNTDTINATGGGGKDDFFVDIGGGLFAPGFTDEGDGTSEIEIHVNAGGGLDQVGADGGGLSDFLVLGSGGFNLNGDSDADVIFSETEFLGLFGFEGNDTLTARGGFGTGGPVGAAIFGFQGNDRILSGRRADFLGGGSGKDVVKAGPGRDRVGGGSGADKLFGQEGNDRLSGRGGNDRLVGGPGNDTCVQGPGRGTIRSCEKPASVLGGGGGGGGGGDGGNCHPSYPTVCIPPPPPDLDCAQVNATNFTVTGSDPHGFDGDNDGIGCET